MASDANICKQQKICETCVGDDEIKAINHWVQSFEKNTDANVQICKIIYQFMSETYWCYNCYVSTKKKCLYYCNHCKQAKYCSLTCLRKNAKYHKSNCYDHKLRDTMIDEINTYSIEQCVKELTKGGDGELVIHDNQWTVLYLTQIRSTLFRMNIEIESTKLSKRTRRIKDMVQSLLRGSEALSTIASLKMTMNTIWSVPGMVELILHERFTNSCTKPIASDIWCRFWSLIPANSVCYPPWLKDGDDTNKRSTIFPKNTQKYFPMYRLAKAKILNLMTKTHVMSNCECLRYVIPPLARQFLCEEDDEQQTMRHLLIEKGLIDSIISILINLEPSPAIENDTIDDLLVNIFAPNLNSNAHIQIIPALCHFLLLSMEPDSNPCDPFRVAKIFKAYMHVEKLYADSEKKCQKTCWSALMHP